MPFDHPHPPTQVSNKQKNTDNNIKSNNNHNNNNNNDNSERSYTKQLHQVYAGAIAGCATRAGTQPFDVLKIRFQLQVEPVRAIGRRFGKTTTQTANAASTSKYTSLGQAARRIYREEGLRAFWKGHNSGQFTSITYGVAQFWTYEQLKVLLQDADFLQTHRHLTDFICGGVAGMTAAIVSNPFDVIRTRIVAADHGVGYRNMFHAISSIMKYEGPRGLYRGLTPTMMQIVPLVGFNFLFYGCLNDLAETVLPLKNGHLPAWWLLTSGGIAGISSKVLMYPLDFIKKRLQIRGFEKHRTTYGRNQACRSLVDCVNLTIRDEGFLGFYKGLTPTLLKAGLTSALYFSVYDKVKEILERQPKSANSP